MTAQKMANRVIKILDNAFDNFVPRSSFDFYKIKDIEANYIKHKLTGY